MKLVRYCVMNFRSVKNSGWIDCDDVKINRWEKGKR